MWFYKYMPTAAAMATALTLPAYTATFAFDAEHKDEWFKITILLVVCGVQNEGQFPTLSITGLEPVAQSCRQSNG